MNTLILTIHITAALMTTLTIATVSLAAFRQRETRTYFAMLTSFAVTAASGIIMLFVSANGFGRFCVTMSAYAVVVVIARQYYRKQLSISSSL